MTTSTKYNINDQVTVELTPKGLEVLLSDSKKYHVTNPCCELPPPPPAGLTGNKFTTELWNLMQIFGPKTYMGGHQFFVRNVIDINNDISDFQSPTPVSSKKSITESTVAIEIAREDFMESLKKAMSDAGGCVQGVERLTVKELCDILGQNGVRFYFTPSGTCSSISKDRIMKRLLEKLNARS